MLTEGFGKNLNCAKKNLRLNKRNAIVVLKCANFRFLLLFAISNWLHKFSIYWHLCVSYFSIDRVHDMPNVFVQMLSSICSLIPLEFDCVRATSGPVIYRELFSLSDFFLFQIRNRIKKRSKRQWFFSLFFLISRGFGVCVRF